MPDQNNAAVKTRQEKRQERLLKRKAKIKQHGRGLAKVYRNAVLKRAAAGKRKK